RPPPAAAGAGDAQEDLRRRRLGRRRGGGSGRVPALLADLQRRQLVRPIVPAVAGVPFDPVPADRGGLDQIAPPAPGVLVLEHAVLAPPAARDPTGEPLGDPLLQILGV